MRQFNHIVDEDGAKINKPFRVSVFNRAEDILNIEDDGTSLFRRNEERVEEDDRWTFGEYGGKSADLISKGRCEILPEAHRNIKRIHGGRSLKRRKKFNDFDGEISIDQVLNGSMTPFMKKRRVKTKGKTIDVVVSLSIHCGYESDQIANYAKAVAERVFTLVSQGRNVNVYYCSGATDVYANGDGCFTFIKLKSGRNKIDPQRIMTMAYPGMFRYYIFRAEHAGGKDVTSGRGYPFANMNKSKADKTLLSLIESINTNRKIIYDMGDWDKSGGELKSITKWDVESLD